MSCRSSGRTTALDEAVTQFVQAVFEAGQDSVQILARNPLLLTILMEVYWDQPDHKLPTRRVALLEKAEAVFFKRRIGLYRAAKLDEKRCGRG